MKAARPSSPWRIGIDVGGTFNDFVLAHETDGRLLYAKEPSVPNDPSLAVERGVRALLADNNVAPQEVGLIIHGTTLAINTVLQRRGAHVGMVVSRGNRDVFEIGRSRMPTAYDFTASREEPLVPRDLVFEVGARVAINGDIVARPEPEELDALAERLAAAKVETAAVMLINSYRHPSLERAVADGLRARLPGVPISESAAVWPEMREYERGLLAALNAYVTPMMQSYFDRLEERLSAIGIAAPLFITTNNGGTVNLATARHRPIVMALSGPASGVVAAIRVAPADIRNRLVTLDMGGTSTDMAVVLDARPEFTNQARVGDFPLIMPVVAVTAIGAGGGSAVWVDEQGVLKIGPESVGADPGPICYGRGGERLAVTDCYLATGILDPADFLGGRMKLEPEPAVAALDRLAGSLGFHGGDRALAAASAVLRVASTKMAVELSKLLAKRGLDHREFTLCAFGGAGATHACLLAQEAKLARVMVPLTPGTFCALGATLADLRRDYSRSLSVTLGPDGSGFGAVADAVAELEHQGLEWIASEAESTGEPRLSLAAEIRYPTQAFELLVAVPDRQRPGLDGPSLAELFHREHERLYGFADRHLPVRVSTIRVSVTAANREVALPAARATGSGRPVGRRPVYHGGGWIEADLYRREDLPPGSRFSGPAIVEQLDTTIWVTPGWQATVEPGGNLMLRSPQA